MNNAAPSCPLVKARLPPPPQRLSRVLQVLGTRCDPRTINVLTTRNLARVNRLVRAADACNAKELVVLRRWLIDERNKNLAVIGIEYDFDDGARTQGRGDALLLSGETLVVVECKRITDCSSEECKAKRRAHVVRQALGYACRLTSWLQHIELVEGRGQALPFRTVLGATLIGECCDRPAHLAIVGRYEV